MSTLHKIALLTIPLVATALFLVARPSGHSRVPSAMFSTDPQKEVQAPRPPRALMIEGTTAIDCEYFAVYVHPLELDDAGNPRIKIEQVEKVPSNFAQAAYPAAPGTTPGEYSSALVATLSFLPRFYEARDGCEIYIGGYPIVDPSEEYPDELNWDESRLVIERFIVIPADGAPYAKRSKSEKAIGEPDSLSTLSAHIAGGTYRMPSQRSASTVKRTILGFFAVECRSGFVVDPGGRFIVVADDANGRLLQYPLANLRANPSVLVDSTEFACLSEIRGVTCRRWMQDGFKRLLIGCSLDYVMLVDGNNDGIFEGRQSLSHEDWEAAGYWSPSIVQEDYTFYRPTGLFPD